MKATDARALNHAFAEKQKLDINSIFKKIGEQASRGKTFLNISLIPIDPGFRTSVYSRLKGKLTALGYTVTRNHYSDMRDSYDNMNISWAHENND